MRLLRLAHSSTISSPSPIALPPLTTPVHQSDLILPRHHRASARPSPAGETFWHARQQRCNSPAHRSGAALPRVLPATACPPSPSGREGEVLAPSLSMHQNGPAPKTRNTPPPHLLPSPPASCSRSHNAPRAQLSSEGHPCPARLDLHSPLPMPRPVPR